jgi:dTDP-3-amino-3,4,6-trideoxy-alpha-D-glucose transaminase
MIPQADPARRIARYRSEIDAAIDRVLSGTHYILGPAVEAFEAAFAGYVGVGHCVGVASGTDALALALRSLNIGPGDEVITVALTASGTAQAILHCGAEPRFVDVDPATRCIDPAAVEAAISSRTAAIMPVHLFGQPADMPRLMEIARRHRLAVIEDCAQAHGATISGRRLGSFGHAAAFSFYPTKNLGCIGDGGAVATGDAAVAARLRSLRHYGWEGDSRISEAMGFNSRLDEIQAAILQVMLGHLDEGNAERRALADEYRRSLDGLELDLPAADPGAVYHQFAIACENRDALSHRLRQAGIASAVHYHPPLHLQPAFLAFQPGALPHTEFLAARLLSLPIQPEIASDKIGLISETIARAIA